MADINPDIFREYDIRGIYGTELTEEYVELIGKAYGTLIKRNNGKAVSTGRDCRLSSPSLSESLIKGITSTGINVINIGIISTPILYFSLFNMEVDGGVMLTASHNPGDYNGLKLSIGKDSLFGKGIQGLRKMIEAEDFDGETITVKTLWFLSEKFESERVLRDGCDEGSIPFSTHWSKMILVECLLNQAELVEQGTPVNVSCF